MKRVDKTGFGKLVIVQDDEQFCYGIDAVALAAFAKLSNKDEVLDLCSGNGIVAFILAHKYKCKKIVGLELQKQSFDLAIESLERNSAELESAVTFVNADAKDVSELFDRESFSAVTCNPPYFECERGIAGDVSAKNAARFETSAKLEDFLKASAYVLKDRGRLFMIHRPERLVDIIEKMRACKLEPKRMRFIVSTLQSKPRMVMIEAVKNANPELDVEPDLVVHGDADGYSEEIQKIYERM